jgi:hypothetical protein
MKDTDKLINVELSKGDIALFKHLLRGKSLHAIERCHYVIGTRLEERLMDMTDFEIE